jgi:hypothetical protein
MLRFLNKIIDICEKVQNFCCVFAIEVFVVKVEKQSDAGDPSALSGISLTSHFRLRSHRHVHGDFKRQVLQRQISSTKEWVLIL